MADIEKFLNQVDTYLDRQGWKESTLGQRVNGDRFLITRIRARGKVWSDTLDKVRAYMKSNPPSKKARKQA